MSVPVLTFFNNKGGVGKTSLVYHLAWMLSKLGQSVLACDLDPQANLTAAFLKEEQLESIWLKSDDNSARTIFQCVKPLIEVGDIKTAQLVRLRPNLNLIPGDLLLSRFEDTLSLEWQNAMNFTNLFRPFRILTAFSTILQEGAKKMDSSIILADLGPNLGAINRSVMVATDYVVVPLGTDIFSLQGLRNLGPTLRVWRDDWNRRKSNWQNPKFELPLGNMKPIGYVVQQHGVRLSRPVKAYDKWINRMPKEYAKTLMRQEKGPFYATPSRDKNCLATVKNYRSLVPMAQEARKPIFLLTYADGAIGGHAAAVSQAYCDFKALARLICKKIDLISDIPIS